MEAWVCRHDRENKATVQTTIVAMLLQSNQKEIHVSADWTKDEGAWFGNLLVGIFSLEQNGWRNNLVFPLRIRLEL